MVVVAVFIANVAVDEPMVAGSGQHDIRFDRPRGIDDQPRTEPAIMPDGTAHPDMQLNVMNSRVVELLAQDPDGWALAGDQLYVDLDLSAANLPTGTQLSLGDAVIEVTDQPHTGCSKFSARFGGDALRFVNSAIGKELRLRGLNARVITPGTIRRGDRVARVVGDPMIV